MPSTAGKLAVGHNHLGKAVFAVTPFSAGCPIIEFKGPRIHRSQLPDDRPGASDHFMQIGRELYLGPSGELDDLINHSCNPNAGLKFEHASIHLVAIRDIVAGEEITWDYSTTLFETPWAMTCACGSTNCRGTIGDFKTLPRSLQSRYRALDIIPPYLFAYLDQGAKMEDLRSPGH